MGKIHRAFDKSYHGYKALCGSNVYSKVLRSIDESSCITQLKSEVTCKRCLVKKTRAEEWHFVSDQLNTLTLARDSETKMAKVMVNDECVYSGNYWDYHNGCHSVHDFPFDDVAGFISGLKALALREGMEVTYLVEEYSYNE